MSFSTLTTNVYRLLMGSILALLLVIGMALPTSAMNTTATSRTGETTSGTLTSVVFQLRYVSAGEKLDSAPPAPGCQGANANSAICQNSSGGAG